METSNVSSPSDSKYSTVTVKLDAYNAGHTSGTVMLDGVPVKSVRHIKIEAGYNRVTEVTLTLMAAVDIEICSVEVVQE